MMTRALAATLAYVLTAAASAQGIEPKPPPPLPDPPLLAHYLFENPWPVVAALVLVAAVTYAVLNARGKLQRARQIAGLLALLAAAVWGIANLVKTQREQALEITARLVADVAKGNAQGVAATLAPGAVVYSDQYPKGQGKDLILEKITLFFGPSGQFPLQDAAVVESQAAITNPTLAQVQVKVRVEPKDFGYPILSWWRLDLSPKAGGGWNVDGIRYMSSNVPLTW